MDTERSPEGTRESSFITKTGLSAALVTCLVLMGRLCLSQASGAAEGLVVVETMAYSSRVARVKLNGAADSTTIREETHTLGAGLKGILSPNKSHIAYTFLQPRDAIGPNASGRSVTGPLVVIELDGSKRRVLDTDAYYSYPTWSTDSALVIYSRPVSVVSQTNATEIVSVDLLTGQLRQIFAGAAPVELIGVSGATSELVIRDLGFPGTPIKALDPRTKAVRTIGSLAGCCHHSFSLSHDGRLVVYAHLKDKAAGLYAIVTLDIVTSVSRTVVEAPHQLYRPLVGGQPSRLIYGQQFLPGSQNRGLTAFDLLTGVPTALPAPPGNGIDVPVAISGDGVWAMVRTHGPPQSDVFYALDMATGRRDLLTPMTATVAPVLGGWLDFIGWVP